MWKKCVLLVFFIVASLCDLWAQKLRSPLDISILLSGNFGELRNNHFHSGIDFKTQGVEGKPVYAVDDGYISRLFVSPWGYGKGIYLTHTKDSLMSVYGHLQKFTEKIAQFIEAKQYEQEGFSIDIQLDSTQFLFHKGDIIGYSGNSGSSGGPHLHFEIRDTRTGDPIDPLPFYKNHIKDSKAPKVKELMIYPIENEGVVNGKQLKQKIQLITAKDGTPSYKTKIEAWGKIGFSLNIDDFMDGTKNVYGVKEIIMSVDNQVVFSSYLDRFSFDETRFLNAWVDYETWKNEKKFFTKTFVEPGNHLRFFKTVNRGYVFINEERDYPISFKLTDEHGNSSDFSIVVKGKEQAISRIDTTNRSYFFWSAENRFGASGIRLFVPRKSLYNSIYFQHKTIQDSTCLSDIHVIHDQPVPLHKPAQLSLRLLADTLKNKNQYGVIFLHKKKKNWVGGVYREGWIDVEIKELGSYAVVTDTVSPKIIPVNEKNWIEQGTINIRLTDDLSGISSFRGEIDGKYALFEHDGKKSLISYVIDKNRIPSGKHKLEITTTDGAGNTKVFETYFVR